MMGKESQSSSMSTSHQPTSHYVTQQRSKTRKQYEEEIKWYEEKIAEKDELLSSRMVSKEEVGKPNRKDQNSYLAFDENYDKFAKQLAELGLHLHEIPGDGNCLFRALGDQLEGHQENHFQHRCDVVDYMVQYRESFTPFVEDDIPFDRYIARLRKKGTHAGNDAIVAFARLHDLNVVIHQLNQPIWEIQGAKDPRTARELHIAYHNGEHYSSVRTGSKPTLPARHHVVKSRGERDIKEQYKDNQSKPKTSSHKYDNGNSVSKLGQLEDVHHHKVKKIVDKPAPTTVPRDEYSLGQETQKVDSRDENSFRQTTHKAVLRDENSLGQKTEAVMRDEHSLKQQTPKDTVTGHQKHTNLVNIVNTTLDKKYHHSSSMTFNEFLDYFHSQDMSVKDFRDTEAFWDYCDSNSMTILNLYNELRKDPRTQERYEKEAWKKFKLEEQEKMKDPSSIRNMEGESNKSNIQYEKKPDTKLEGKLDVPGPKAIDNNGNQVISSKRKIANADEGELSVYREQSVHNLMTDDEQLSAIKEGKVQISGSQAKDVGKRSMNLKGNAPSLEVENKYLTHNLESKAQYMRKDRMDQEVGCSSHMHLGEEHSSRVLVMETKSAKSKAQVDTTVLGMNGVYCSQKNVAKQMPELDEESDLGHQYQLANVGKATRNAHLDSRDGNIHKSDTRIMNSKTADESPDVKACSGNQMTQSQTCGTKQGHIHVHEVKDKQVYIPPHRRRNQDWQEHMKRGFTGQQKIVNENAHIRLEEYSDQHSVQVTKTATGLVGTVEKQIKLLSEDVDTHSDRSFGFLTQSVEIQVDMENLKPYSRDVSVQCEQMERLTGKDISTSTDDFEDYLQAEQGFSLQANSLSDKQLDNSLLCKSLNPVIADQQLDIECCLDSVNLIDFDTSDQLGHCQPSLKPCSSSTPVKDTSESVHKNDSGIHSSDGELDSFSEFKELIKVWEPISLSSQLVMLDPETVLQELHKDVNSFFQNRDKENSLIDYGIPDFKSTAEEVLMNQHLATSPIYGRILWEMELLRSQRCKNPLKGSGLV